ncbi:MAG: hypothetical protein H0T73_04175, partial [Ardenticatenales bacterium]|nr:hypothetical protein [Ardenticatenales bacterium]
VWEQGLEAAKTLGMPYEQGLIHLEMARALESAAPERLAHLTRAREILTPLGATHDLTLLPPP